MAGCPAYVSARRISAHSSEHANHVRSFGVNRSSTTLISVPRSISFWHAAHRCCFVILFSLIVSKVFDTLFPFIRSHLAAILRLSIESVKPNIIGFPKRSNEMISCKILGYLYTDFNNLLCKCSVCHGSFVSCASALYISLHVIIYKGIAVSCYRFLILHPESTPRRAEHLIGASFS